MNTNMRLAPNSALRAEARQQLNGNWTNSVVIFLVFTILLGIASSLAGIGQLIVAGPLSLGLVRFYIRLKRGGQPAIENLFDGFKRFGESLVLHLLITVFVLLWSLLFIIPGIIAALRYSMAFYIMHDNPEMTGSDALNKSKEMMTGHKGKLFCLYLGFTGWFILCLFTFGIGFLWLYPYINVTVANFYDDLKNSSAKPQEAAVGR